MTDGKNDRSNREGGSGGPGGGRARRARNLPLIVLLLALALIAFSQLDQGGGRLATITYAQLRQLGKAKVLDSYEILHSADHVEIKGDFNKDALKAWLEENKKLPAEVRNELKDRDGYRVTGARRRSPRRPSSGRRSCSASRRGS